MHVNLVRSSFEGFFAQLAGKALQRAITEPDRRSRSTSDLNILGSGKRVGYIPHDPPANQRDARLTDRQKLV